MTRILGTTEAAARVGMRPASFRKYCCRHDAPRLPIVESRGPRGGRRIGIREDDLETFIESMTIRPAGVIPGPVAPVILRRGPQGGAQVDPGASGAD